jgi:hypothetical protein
MNNSFPSEAFEAQIGQLKQLLANGSDDLNEIDQILTNIGQLCTPHQEAAAALEGSMGRWADLRAGESSNETLLSELQLIVYELENLSDQMQKSA